MDCKVFPRPISTIPADIRRRLGTNRDGLTVTENAAKLVFCQEGKPIDSLLLVFAKFRFDLHRKYILLDLAAVQKLR